LIGFSPYGNGSYLISIVSESLGEFQLMCSCGKPPVCTQRGWSSLKTYCVSSPAYVRGYGSAQEIYHPSRYGALLEQQKETR
jgi:hypothetical protein